MTESVSFLVKGSEYQFISVTQLCPILCDPMKHSTPDLESITNSRGPPKPMSIESMKPSNHLILCHLLLLLPSIFPSIRVFSSESALRIRWPSTRVSASTSVLPMNIQNWFPLGWTGLISLQSKDSQDSSPTPQFKNINSSALSFLHSPTLTSIHDQWKNHSLD